MRSASPRSRRRRSIARRRAVVVIHAPGRSGTPSRGQVATRGGEGVLQRVLGEAEVADLADQRGEDRRALLAEGPARRRCVDHGSPARSYTTTGRTSIEP